MKFEDIENLWKNQTLDDPSDLDPRDIEERALTEAKAIEQQTTYFEMGLTAIFFALGAITLFDSIADREPWYSHASAIISLGISAYIYLGRLHRLRTDAGFNETLLGYLDKGINNVEYHVSRVNNFVWWFLLPTLVTYGIAMYFTFDGRPLWVWLFQPFAILLFFITMKLEVYSCYLPKQKQLIVLREQLLDTAEQS